MENSSKYLVEYVEVGDNMNTSIKILTIIILIFILLGNIINTYAFSVSNMTGTDLPQDDQAAVDRVGQGIVKVISTIGSICSVIVLVIIGIKYMLGSTEEKAEYKKRVFPYVIGAFLVFGASVIASAIYNIAIDL